MTASNPLRGDVVIRHPGGAWHLRPNFAAIARLETHFDRGIFDIARDYASGKLARSSDLKAILESGLVSESSDLEAQMMEAGLASLVEPLGRYLAAACGLDE